MFKSITLLILITLTNLFFYLVTSSLLRKFLEHNSVYENLNEYEQEIIVILLLLLLYVLFVIPTYLMEIMYLLNC